MKKVISLSMVCLMALSICALFSCTGNSNGSSGSQTIVTNNVPKGYVDLGLPSGTLWKALNEPGFFTFEEAISQFGIQIPSKEQWEELMVECQWNWTGSGYMVTGPNGNSITLPTTGFRECDGGGVNNTDHIAYYWLYVPSCPMCTLLFTFNSGGMVIHNAERCSGLSVRLVQ